MVCCGIGYIDFITEFEAYMPLAHIIPGDVAGNRFVGTALVEIIVVGVLIAND